MYQDSTNIDINIFIVKLGKKRSSECLKMVVKKQMMILRKFFVKETCNYLSCFRYYFTRENLQKFEPTEYWSDLNYSYSSYVYTSPASSNMPPGWNLDNLRNQIQDIFQVSVASDCFFI